MIIFKNVGKTYSNGFHAIKNINFEIQTGEFAVFIGPSGCGKTTIMKMINRLSPHTEGSIYIDGHDITHENPIHLRQSIGYVIQHAGLFPHYTIADNIALPLCIKKWSKSRIQKRVCELLDMVGLDHNIYAERYPKQLSGGQQQRVGFARALAGNPDIILMDEPFGALDPITREQLQEELIRLQKYMRKTIIFVTHDMDEALKLGERIAIIKDGGLVQFDTPEAILRHPADPFVESFIGKNRLYKNPEFIPVTAIMNEQPAIAQAGLTPARALTLMRRQKTTALIIADEQKKLLGTVSVYEIQTHIEHIHVIGELCSVPETILTNTATAKDALLTIPKAKQGIIPVVDENRTILGVVTRSSLLTAFAQHLEGKQGDEYND